jgi:hypothetical protein
VGIKYACTAFWYLSADGADPYSLPPPAERDGYYVLGDVIRNLQVVPGYPGRVSRQGGMNAHAGNKWRDNAQLWWFDAKIGEKLGLRPTPVKSAGKYALWIGVPNGPCFGIVQFRLDGKKIGQPVDLYSANGGKKDISLGVYDIAAGEHTIEVEIVGTNPKATAHLFGTDFLQWRPSR